MIKTALTAALTWTACTAGRQEAEALPPREGERVRFRPVKNRGAAFGLPLDPRALPLLSAASLLVLLRARRAAPAAAGLALGGGLSNLWERVSRGEVLDYLQFPRLPGRLGKSVYNPADLAILAGGLVMVLQSRGSRWHREGL